MSYTKLLNKNHNSINQSIALIDYNNLFIILDAALNVYFLTKCDAVVVNSIDIPPANAIFLSNWWELKFFAFLAQGLKRIIKNKLT